MVYEASPRTPPCPPPKAEQRKAEAAGDTDLPATYKAKIAEMAATGETDWGGGGEVSRVRRPRLSPWLLQVGHGSETLGILCG